MGYVFEKTRNEWRKKAQRRHSVPLYNVHKMQEADWGGTWSTQTMYFTRPRMARGRRMACWASLAAMVDILEVLIC
jgi:hypothetical protein